MEYLNNYINFDLQYYEFKRKKSFIFLIIIASFLIILLLNTNAVAQDSGQWFREPVFAGMFYPSDKNTLSRQIDGYLMDAEKRQDRIKGHIFGLVSPHAGYEYSGGVAAYGFSQLKGRSYKTVIIIGTSHQVPFRGISIYPKGQWRTPLGDVRIDEECVRALLKECPQIKTYTAPFVKEHSLEVQIPFLQKVLGDFRIVPLITGGIARDEYALYVNGIVNLLKRNPKDILIVVSSDMSHYHDYNTARSIDDVTLKHIENMDVERLIEDMDAERCELCGGHGVVLLTMIARHMNGKAVLLKYANSGDVKGDKQRVVGYSSFAFFYNDGERILNKKSQEVLLGIARKTLEEYVTRESIPRFDVKDKELLEKRGAFVTLKKRGELRGCIGYIQPLLPLYKAVVDMTVAAASKDMRFIPVHKGELRDIKIEISVLTPLRRITRLEEIEVGRHGIYIKKGDNSGLLLPQVATEYNWDREEFLRQTCIKAGLYRNAWKDKKTEIYTFTAQVISE